MSKAKYEQSNTSNVNSDSKIHIKQHTNHIYN